MARKSIHRPDGSPRWADRCECGAEIVFFEDGDTDGHGCLAFGRPTRAFAIPEEA